MHKYNINILNRFCTVWHSAVIAVQHHHQLSELHFSWWSDDGTSEVSLRSSSEGHRSTGLAVLGTAFLLHNELADVLWYIERKTAECTVCAEDEFIVLVVREEIAFDHYQYNIWLSV